MSSEAALVPRARGGDELAFRRLLDRCEDIIDWQLRRFYEANGLERADLRQEALVGLHKAVRDYRPDGGSGFRNFASLCIQRQIITAVKMATRAKHRPINQALSLAKPIPGGADHEDVTLGEILPGPADADPAQRLEQVETLATIADAVHFLLTPLEKQAIIGRADGLGYEEIARREGLTFKQIDNAVQRGKAKLGRALELAA